MGISKSSGSSSGGGLSQAATWLLTSPSAAVGARGTTCSASAGWAVWALEAGGLIQRSTTCTCRCLHTAAALPAAAACPRPRRHAPGGVRRPPTLSSFFARSLGRLLRPGARCRRCLPAARSGTVAGQRGEQPAAAADATRCCNMLGAGIRASGVDECRDFRRKGLSQVKRA